MATKIKLNDCVPCIAIHPGEIIKDELDAREMKQKELAALVEDGGYKPRLAFGPVRVAISGRRVSPPLFESMEIVGKPLTIARLKGLREHL